MSMVEGLAEIVLWAADIEVALEFYRDRLGLEVISPPAMPNKFLRVGKGDGIPEMIVLVPHPHPDDYFPRHKEKRVLHHLAFRVDAHSYDELERRFIDPLVKQGRCRAAGESYIRTSQRVGRDRTPVPRVADGSSETHL